MRLRAASVIAVLSVLAVTGSASAQRKIVSPFSGVINSGGPGFGSLSNTWDQSGLSIGFTSGVTDFATYLALNPLHTTTFAGFEWFSNMNTTTANVTYDLGAVMNISGLALWNEESSGIGLLNLLGSSDGVNFFNLATGLTPFDNPLAGVSSYPAEVFNFGARNVRYVTFDMSGCPQPVPGSFPSCAIGEVAFAQGSAGVVPEPGSMVLLATGLLGLGAARRRRRNAIEAAA